MTATQMCSLSLLEFPGEKKFSWIHLSPLLTAEMVLFANQKQKKTSKENKTSNKDFQLPTFHEYL